MICLLCLIVYILSLQYLIKKGKNKRHPEVFLRTSGCEVNSVATLQIIAMATAQRDTYGIADQVKCNQVVDPCSGLKRRWKGSVLVIIPLKEFLVVDC